MQERIFWFGWAQFLHRWNLTNLAAAFLEGGAPVNLLLAQVLFAGEPLFSQPSNRQHWQALADLLEDRNASREFAAYLREET